MSALEIAVVVLGHTGCMMRSVRIGSKALGLVTAGIGIAALLAACGTSTDAGEREGAGGSTENAGEGSGAQAGSASAGTSGSGAGGSQAGQGGSQGGAAQAGTGGAAQAGTGGANNGGNTGGDLVCGTAPCGKAQYCVFPCCGGAPPACFAAPANATCPAGSHSGCVAPFSGGCTPPANCCQAEPCSPPPPYCTDKAPIGCVPQQDRSCRLSCG
jgi:hypothetical protein